MVDSQRSGCMLYILCAASALVISMGWQRGDSKTEQWWAEAVVGTIEGS